MGDLIMAPPPPTGEEEWSSAMLSLGTCIAIELRQGTLHPRFYIGSESLNVSDVSGGESDSDGPGSTVGRIRSLDVRRTAKGLERVV